MNAIRGFACSVFLPTLLLLTGCGRAPSFDILGSFFPAWLVCLVVGPCADDRFASFAVSLR